MYTFGSIFLFNLIFVRVNNYDADMMRISLPRCEAEKQVSYFKIMTLNLNRWMEHIVNMKITVYVVRDSVLEKKYKEWRKNL